MKISLDFPMASTIFTMIIGLFLIVYVFTFFKKNAYLKEYFRTGSGSVPSLVGGSKNFIDVGPTSMLTLGSKPTVGAIQRTQIEDEGITSDRGVEKTVYPSKDEVTLTSIDTPYTQEPIQEVDDYEYNMVYANESNTPLSKELRQKLIRQYPMHWTGYPPSSSQFQAGLQESFRNATQDVPDDAKPYQNISGSLMAPPDLSEMEREERKILQTYKPDFPPKATMYDERDARKLIKKIYDAKGLIPDIKHREGTNVYEVTGTRRKNEKVVYEDEAPASGSAVEGAGEDMIQAPFSLPETARSSEKNPWNYTAWTPGLDKVFSPGDPRKNWA